MDLREQFGDIDIYLFDQLLRGRITPGMRVLDAGCGAGRNLVYLLREGYDVSAVDESETAIAAARRTAARLAPTLAQDAIRVEAVEAMTFRDGSFDVVLSSAVLHFARDEAHVRAMLDAMWRVLRPGGLVFIRLASTIGMAPDRFTPLGGHRYYLPDGSERFLVDEDFIMNETDRLGAQLGDPIKTTVVQDVRCMTTWILRKT